MILAPALGAAFAGAMVHGALYPNSFVFGSVISRVRSATPALALTFDDGPNAEATPAILDALGERGVKASFFVLGRHAERLFLFERRKRPLMPRHRFGSCPNVPSSRRRC